MYKRLHWVGVLCTEENHDPAKHCFPRFFRHCDRIMGVPHFSLNGGALILLTALIFLYVPGIRAQSGDPTNEQRLTLVIDVLELLHITSPSYLSITFSSGQLRRGLVGYDFSSQKLKNLAAALSPADVRVGGTYSDFLNFDPISDDANCVEVTAPGKKSTEELDFTLSGQRWDNITRFCDQVGWDILWDLNLLDRHNGSWDPTLAEEFLDYSSSRGMKIPMFELGNEPNLYERKFGVILEADQLVKDYSTLKDLLSQMPQYAASGLYAPGVNNLDTFSSSRKYLAQFLQNDGCEVTTEVALHHYYFKAEEAHTQDFVDVEVMDTLRTQLEFAYNISWSSCRSRKPIRFTETSTASGGGVPDVSNAFIAGFLWLDKLGLSATFGITRVFRQTFLKSSYALVTKNLKPNPDYYLSVLFKRLVEGPVFSVSNESLKPEVRIYAQCVGKSYYNYPDGAIVVYYLNVGSESSVLSLGQFQGTDVHLFILSPGDENGMLSRKVKLNDELLEMNGSDLPSLEPKPHSGDVPLAPKTFGFIVIPEADVQLCKQYHRHDEGKIVSC
ncbi:hypothetical protein RRG08_050776 [Elysia crispata]|uniref:Heparanase n=1 Tax=Elysia crispata TaxID=231223 RepID=A0AAE0YGC5_9GAST|nr:hypothetical protein RRG08_050776 [Elysia crispata]